MEMSWLILDLGLGLVKQLLTLFYDIQLYNLHLWVSKINIDFLVFLHLLTKLC